MDDVPSLPVSAFVTLTSIWVPSRLRHVDDAWVQALAANIDDHGLEQPIIVRPIRDHESGADYALVAGAHRYGAVRLLGRDDIQAVIRDINEDEARLVEIDENLMRRELVVIDKAISLRERKAVHERLYPSTRHGGNRRNKVDDHKSHRCD